MKRKALILLRRAAGVATEAFAKAIDADLPRALAQSAPQAGHRRRNLLVPGGTVTATHIADVPPPPRYDAILEYRIDDDDALSALVQGVATLDTQLGPAADAWLDHRGTRMLVVASHATPADQLPLTKDAPRDGSGVKMMIDIHRRPGMSPDAFRDHYEAHHAPLAARHRRGIWAGYRRNYVIGSHFAENPADTADAISELWFRTEEDFRAMRHRDPVLGPLITEDEGRLMDRSAIRLFRVEEKLFGEGGG